MDATSSDETMSLDEQAQRRGVASAVMYGVNDDLEVEYVNTIAVAPIGGLLAVVTRCFDGGEEAELMDAAGRQVGCVACDGSIEWAQ